MSVLMITMLAIAGVSVLGFLGWLVYQNPILKAERDLKRFRRWKGGEKKDR